MSDEKLAHVIRYPHIRQGKSWNCIKKAGRLPGVQTGVEEQKNENHIRTDQKESRKDVSGWDQCP